MYVISSLPLTAALATVPAPLLTGVFPAGYGMMSTLLGFTAVTGFTLGAINLIVTFSQAEDDYACARRQFVGLAGYALALLVGWKADGVRGIAMGGAAGAVCALALLLHRLVRRQGTALLTRLPLTEPLLLAALLVVLHPYPQAWLIAATAVGARAVQRFLRRPDTTATASPPLTSHERGTTMPRRPADGTADRAGRPQMRPGDLLVAAVWRGDPRPAGDTAVRHALALARDNQVEGRLARAYPRQLADVVTEVATANALFRANLSEVTGRLDGLGIPTVLVKADLTGDNVYGDFDLVVPEGRWKAACDALEGWYVHRSEYWLERSTKVLLEPRHGPAAHLHTAVSWFGVPVIPTRRLFERAVPDGGPWLVPHPADELRIWLAHGFFQNLSLDLSELLALRDLLPAPDVVAKARREAAREGWPTGADRALTVATEAMRRLDHGLPVRLPVPLPVAASLRVGGEHALHLLRHGRPRAAVREAVLRAPLVVAKKRRMLVP
jgi:hypothetical protein